jgi:predicted RNase H-like nuclease (RuvC/YqgF family)
MPNFVCEKCNKNFLQKSAYTSHIMRLNPCIKDNTIINSCEYCKKIYSTKYKLKNHLNICKKKKIFDDCNQLQIEELKKMFEHKFEEQQKKFEEQQKEIIKTQKDNEELKKKVEELSHTTESNQNININENSHNTTTTNNTINIYSSGKEDLTRLSQEDILKLCTSGTYYPIVAAEILHCNEKYPKHICL